MSNKLHTGFLLALLTMLGITNQANAWYCRPAYSGTCCAVNYTTEITKFTIGTYSWANTACYALNGYDTSHVGSAQFILYKGKTYAWNGVTPTYGGYWGIWIDLNNDGDFNDKGELLDSSKGTTTTNYKGNIKIPTTVKPGIYRMRIRHAYNAGGPGSPGPSLNYTRSCTSYTYGGTLDYTVAIFDQYCQDAGVTAILSPIGGTCGDSFTKVKVIVKNFGVCSISKTPVYFRAVGGGTFVFTDTIRKTIAPGNQDTLTFSSTLNSFNGVTYNILATTLLSPDSGGYNDTFLTKVGISSGVSSGKYASTKICGSGKVKLYSDSVTGYNTFWYNSKTSTKKVGIGDTFVTPVLNYPATYYAVTTSAFTYSVGPANNNFGTGSGLNNFPAGCLFDALSTFTLDSVTVYPQLKGWVVINLQDASGKKLIIDSHYVTPSKQYAKTTLYCGYVIQPGKNYELTAENSNVGNLYRNNSGASYPYYASGVVSITNNNYTPPPAGYYYYFYNWQITGPGCSSPRIAVKAGITSPPSAITLTAGKPFKGAYGNGTAGNPDTVGVGDTVNYILNPPTGLTNAGFGTTWKLKSWSFKTLNNTVGKDTIFNRPSASGNGNFMFFPAMNLGDSMYRLTMTFTNSSNCDTSFSRYIYVSAKPKADFAFLNACANTPIVFLNNSTAGKSILNYTWDFGDGGTSILAQPKHIYAKGGIYKVLLTAITGSGNKDTVSHFVTAFEAPVAKFSAATVCLGASSVFTDSSKVAGSSTISAYLWEFGDSSSSTTSGTVSHNYTYSGLKSAKLTVVSSLGCMDSTFRTVYVNITPTASFSHTAGCAIDSVSFTNSTKTGFGTTIYTWTFDDGNFSNNLSPVHLYAQGGAYNVKLVALASGGCKDSQTNKVEVFAQPKAYYSNGPLCLEASVQFTDSTKLSIGTINSYYWDFTDSTNSATKNPKHQFVYTKTYRPLLKVTTDKGCTDTFSKPLYVDSLRANFTSRGTCDKSPTIFKNSNVLKNTTRFWEFGDGDTASGLNLSHIYKAPGTYVAKFTVTTGKNGCVSSIQKNVTINPSPNSAFQDSVNTFNCIWTFTPSDSTLASYTWAYGDGDTAKAFQGLHKYKKSGSHDVVLITRNTFGCTTATSHTVQACTVSAIEGGNKNTFTMNVAPNPFGGYATLSYQLAKPTMVKVTLMDIHGKLAGTLVPTQRQAVGSYSVNLDAHSLNLAGGIYLVRFEADGEIMMKEVVHIK